MQLAVTVAAGTGETVVDADGLIGTVMSPLPAPATAGASPPTPKAASDTAANFWLRRRGVRAYVFMVALSMADPRRVMDTVQRVLS